MICSGTHTQWCLSTQASTPGITGLMPIVWQVQEMAWLSLRPPGFLPSSPFMTYTETYLSMGLCLSSPGGTWGVGRPRYVSNQVALLEGKQISFLGPWDSALLPVSMIVTRICYRLVWPGASFPSWACALELAGVGKDSARITSSSSLASGELGTMAVLIQWWEDRGSAPQGL